MRQISGDANPIEYGGFFKKRNGDWLFWNEPQDSKKIPVYGGSRPTDSDFSWCDWTKILSYTGESQIPEDPHLKLRSAAEYYGWDNFDAYPINFTAGELRRRIR